MQLKAKKGNTCITNCVGGTNVENVVVYYKCKETLVPTRTKQIVFYFAKETIQHLFFSVILLDLFGAICSLLSITLHLVMLKIFLVIGLEGYLGQKKMILTRASVLCWLIWHCHDDKVFSGKQLSNPMQLIFIFFLLASLLVYDAFIEELDTMHNSSQ